MIPRRCHRCGRPVWVWPWQVRVCRDFERCIDEHRIIEVLLTETSEEPVGVDPLLFEQAPDDIEKCSQCMGFGQVVRLDWESGPVYEDCKRCLTTGVDPSLCPV